MDCRNVRRLLDQGVSPGSSDARCATLGFHLSGCAECRVYRRDLEAQRVLSALLAQPLCAPRATARAARRRPASRPLRMAGAALLVGGALAMLPTTSIVFTTVAQAKPAVAKPGAARRDNPPLARAWASYARVAVRDDTVLLQSLLDEPLAPPAERGTTTLLELLLAEPLTMSRTSAADAREMRLARSELAPGQELIIPAMPVASADSVPEQQTTYVVVSGDSLWAIAQRYWGDGTLWWAIYNANLGMVGGNPNLIYPNQRLTIPAKPTPDQAIWQGPTVPAGNYTIVRGDTLSHIALRRLGNANRWPEIYNLNRGVIGANPHLIYPGTVISLP